MQQTTRGFRKILTALWVLAAPPASFAQGSFHNLDFESAIVPPVPPGQALFISAADAFPGWTVYAGSNQSTQALYNGISVGGALVSLIDLHTAFLSANVIAGNFTATLDAGYNGSTGIVSAALGQTGTIPANTRSLVFDANGSVSSLLVTFNGVTLPFVEVGSRSNYQIYAANISSLAGQTGELRFTERPNTPFTFPIAYLDNILFSTASVPEPGAVALFLMGALLAGGVLFSRQK